MICPECHSEYRAGFTRCATCEVDLVEVVPREPRRDVAAEHPDEPVDEGTPIEPVQYCGYLSLEDARQARDELREHRIRSHILVAEPPRSDLDEPAREEYWLLVPRRHLGRVDAILGHPADEQVEADAGEPAAAEGNGETFACSACGADVDVTATSCPRCGARFEE